MLKVLIVDDEVLVRRSLIKLISWSKYDMDVVGDMPNGIAALEFMREHEVDIVMTDLLMPGMDGFELLDRLHKQYPNVLTVVLSCLEDIDDVRRALHAGITDYIAKTRFDFDKTDEMLIYLSARAKEREALKQEAIWCRADKNEVLTISDRHGIQPLWLSQDTVLLSGKGVDTFLRDNALNTVKGVILALSTPEGKKIVGRTDLIDAYLDRVLFYEYRDGKRVYQAHSLFVENSGDLNNAEKALDKYDWLLNRNELNALIKTLESCRYPASRLIPQLAQIFVAYEQMLPKENEWIAQLAQGHISWIKTRIIMCELYEKLRKIVNDNMNDISESVTYAVLKVVWLMRNPQKLLYSQQEIAKEVGISRSYLSRCFKRIIGVNFSAYIKQARIRYARTRLLETDDPVYMVANDCGFEDERHFSQVFMENTGMSPVQYRQTGGVAVKSEGGI